MQYHIRLKWPLLLVVLSLLTLCTAAYPKVLYVKTNGLNTNNGLSWATAKKTVAAALSSSQAGDEIWVASGIYGERITIKSGIRLYGGFNGTESTRDERNWETNISTLDGFQADDTGTVVTFAPGVSANTGLDGFEILGGIGTLIGIYSYGGGIFCFDHSSPTIANNTIRDNYATNGAGIFLCNFSRPVIVNNRIFDNYASDWGGGIYGWYDPPVEFPPSSNPPTVTISRNHIAGNYARYGGGLALFASAALSNDKPSATVTNNYVFNNGAPTSDSGSVGGGIYCENISPAHLTGNNVAGNTAGRSGGIHYSNSTGAIIGNRVSGNAGQWGGGIGLYHASSPIANNEVICNTSETRGAGIYAKGYVGSRITNNTIASNTCESPGGAIYLEDSDPAIKNNVIAFNSSGVAATTVLPTNDTVVPTFAYNCFFWNNNQDYLGTAKRGNGDISVDPKFASLKYGNVHLQPGSPCINAGSNQAVDPGWRDIDGDTRIQNGRVDMGADESDGTNWTDTPAVVICVDPITGNDLNDGSSWELAKQTIQNAIDETSAYGGEVWVKGATYVENLVLRPYVHVFGGFVGDETERSQRDWKAHPAVLQPSEAQPAVTVTRGHGINTIDGFRIEGAQAVHGAGVYCFNASPYIVNNTFVDCVATGYGGAIHCDALSSPVIQNNTITGCSGNMAGGIFVYRYSNPTITGNTIISNLTDKGGSGITIAAESTPIVSNNVIALNGYNAGRFGVGAGIFIQQNEEMPSPRITNNVIYKNGAAGSEGEAIFVDGSAPVISNNIIAHNGSGLYLPDGAAITSNNCLFENAGYNYSGQFPGVGDIEADPKFVNAAAGDFHLATDSQCIDRGNDSVVREGELDKDGSPRVYGAHVDIGAYEWRGLSNVSLTPDSGPIAPGSAKIFESKYAHPDGFESIDDCYLLINNTLIGAKAICVRYSRIDNKLYVRNENNSAWVGGYAPGTSNVLDNGYCKLHCNGTTVTGDDTMLTVRWMLEAKPTMAGKICGAWMLVDDKDGLRAGWDKKGAFDISQPPTNVSVTPSSGTVVIGEEIVISAKYADLDGFNKITSGYVLINTDKDATDGVSLYYNAKTNKLYLRNNANTDWIGGYTPGTASVIENSQIKVHCSETTVSGGGAYLTVNWKVTVKPSMSRKDCKIWLRVEDNTGLIEDWTEKGTMAFSQRPVNVSLSPFRGNLVPGKDITFTAKYSDPDGHADLANCYMLMNTWITGVDAVYTMYDVKTNKLYIRDIGNREWVGGVTPGDTRILENANFSLDCSQTTVFKSGSDIQIGWRIKLKNPMINRPIGNWFLAIDNEGLRAGWDQMGLFSIGL